ncbi:MAG: hypothetical protein RR731_05370, partial [Oscillospiraceae bacterium]
MTENITETTSETTSEKNFEKRLTHMLPAKIAAFILLAFTSILSVGYAMGSLVMLNYDALILDFRGIHLSDYTS